MAKNHDFGEKSIGCCSTYDVVATGPEQTRPLCCQKLRYGCPINSEEFQRAPPSALAVIKKAHGVYPPFAAEDLPATGWAQVIFALQNQTWWGVRQNTRHV